MSTREGRAAVAPGYLGRSWLRGRAALYLGRRDFDRHPGRAGRRAHAPAHPVDRARSAGDHACGHDALSRHRARQGRGRV